MQIDAFERAMVGIVVGNTAHQRPSDMKTAVAVLDALELFEAEIVSFDGHVSRMLELSGQDPRQCDLSEDQKKFIARVMIKNGQFGGRMLRALIPFWERLYPKWEELAPD